MMDLDPSGVPLYIEPEYVVRLGIREWPDGEWRYSEGRGASEGDASRTAWEAQALTDGHVYEHRIWVRDSRPTTAWAGLDNGDPDTAH